ncbi:hypothetical protein EVAR_38093_1 [Eumeta japonica]|uniref:Uncharacterized protein n=1 Tax=Eumeta variegata TaxID=151549 RepID=A0A4C1WB01_EUMVA|nr:hypothetical protein EVAR_38093_1 [Eumeta japonica]
MITEVQKKLVVGYNLFHPTSNHLGSFLLDFCEQHNLVISSTWGRRSCKTRSSKIYEGKILEEQVSQRSCHDTELQGRQERTTGPTRKEDEEKCQHFFTDAQSS